MESQLLLEEWNAWKRYQFSLKSFEPIIFVGNIEWDEKSYEFEVIYPYAYPFMQPSARCTTLENGIHQTPGDQGLCLWEFWKDYPRIGADEIYQRMRLWLKGQFSGFDPKTEVEHKEPKRYHFYSQISGNLLIEEKMLLEFEKEKEGTFELSISHRDTDSILFLLNKVNKKNTKLNAEHFAKETYQKGVYFVTEQTPPYFKVMNELIEWLTNQGFSEISEKIQKNQNDKNIRMLSVKYPDGFVSAMEFDNNEKILLIFENNIVSEEILFRRVPTLRPLKRKKAVVVGLGTIGSAVALEMTKAGFGEITLIDKDTLSVGNLVRHTSELSQIGSSKTSAVEKQLQSHNPYLKVKTYYNQVGMAQEDLLKEIIGKADIVVCAVGHSPTERYVNKIAQEQETPVVYAYAGIGVRSGRVFRTIPNQTGCYHCHMYGVDEGSLPPLIHAEVNSIYEEQNCGEPSYPGSGIDTGTISLLAARLVLQTIFKNKPKAYISTPYDHFLWDQEDWSIQKFSVSKREDCPYCARKEKNELTHLGTMIEKIQSTTDKQKKNQAEQILLEMNCEYKKIKYKIQTINWDEKTVTIKNTKQKETVISFRNFFQNDYKLTEKND